MEKEILKQILGLLEDFKKEQLILLLIVFFVFIVIQLFQAVYTSRLIDKYRNELKKKELKFSLFNELQIKSLSNLYGLINAIKSGTASIYGSIKRKENQKLELRDWTSFYEDYSLFLNTNKYILPRNIKDLISENSKKLTDFNGNILILNAKLDLILSSNNLVEEDLEQISIAEKELDGYNFEKSALEIMLFSEQLKKDIEVYFERLE